MAKIKSPANNSHKTKPRGVKQHAFERVYWPYIPIVFIIGTLLMFGGQSGALRASLKHPTTSVLAYSTSMSISGLLADTNAQRTGNGIAELAINSQLNAAAQAKANDMAARNYWSHNTPEGNPPWVFVQNEGYAYQKLGENLAAGFDNEQSTINGWMASPPHRENLLDPAYTEVGFGYANNPDYTSAGGGPMTIVVAFYGEPQVLAASQSVPPPPPEVHSTSTSSTPTPTDTATPTQTPEEQAPTQSQDKPKKSTMPATTKTPSFSLPTSQKASRAQLSFAQLPFAQMATNLTIAAAVIISSLWVSRHILAIRRFIVKGEAYAIAHPLTDVGLIIIVGLLIILSQTAGLVQ